MSTKKETTKKTDTAEAPNELTQQERVAACSTEIDAVLAKYQCRVNPFIAEPERIGNSGGKMLLTAGVSIVPAEAL